MNAAPVTAPEPLSIWMASRRTPVPSNRSDAVVRFLSFSNQQPDIVVYPESGKIGAFERRPEGGGLYKFFRAADAVGYWEGE